MSALFFHTIRLFGSTGDVEDAIEWIEGLDQALQIFDEEPLEVFRRGSAGVELTGVRKSSRDSLENLAWAFREISKSWFVESEWFATSSSNGFHTAARFYRNGFETVVFDGPYYFTSLEEARDASLASKGSDEDLVRLVARFFAALKRLGRHATLEDDACALALSWHLCLGENIVPRLLAEEADPGRWEAVLESLRGAQESSEVLDFGEMENVETLFREVIRDAKILPRLGR